MSKNKDLGASLSVDTKGACRELNVSRTTLYQLVRAGRIKPFRIGARGQRFAIVELERFMSEGGV